MAAKIKKGEIYNLIKKDIYNSIAENNERLHEITKFLYDEYF